MKSGEAMLDRLIAEGKRVFVFLGETGVGKSEVALDLALSLACAGKPVDFLDMDQTKSVFRSRDVASQLARSGIRFNDQPQFLDARTVPAAVRELIQDRSRYSVLDVGGAAQGAVVIGQYADLWNSDVVGLMLINSHRAFLEDRSSWLNALDEVVTASRMADVRVVSNPNFGAPTTAEDVVEGHRRLESLLAGGRYRIETLTTLAHLQHEVQRQFPNVTVSGINRRIVAPWEADGGDQFEGSLYVACGS